jgi:hypothetical protein
MAKSKSETIFGVADGAGGARGGTLGGRGGLGFAGWRPTGETPMDKQTKTEIWDLVAGTFIAVSIVSGMAFIVASAIH